MERAHRQRAMAAGALCVLLGIAVGSCGESDRVVGTGGSVTEPAPAPNSPAGLLRLLEWSYDHLSVSRHDELFTEDYLGNCSPPDSAGGGWRGIPWTLEDERRFATHLFVGGASEPPARFIRLTLDRNFFVYPDPRFVAWDPFGRWHKTVRTTAALSGVTVEGSGIDVFGPTRFFLVRGDSASIPQHLQARGFGPDSARWYIRGWEDETLSLPARPDARESRSARASGGPSALGAQPAGQMSWCQLKRIYH